PHSSAGLMSDGRLLPTDQQARGGTAAKSDTAVKVSRFFSATIQTFSKYPLSPLTATRLCCTALSPLVRRCSRNEPCSIARTSCACGIKGASTSKTDAEALQTARSDSTIG